MDQPIPFDYVGTLERLVGDLRSVADRRVLFNLTGGPKTMAVAAAMACLLLGIPVLYVPEEEPNPVPIPLPIVRMRYVNMLTPKMHEVLHVLAAKGDLSAAELARGLRIAHSTLDYHLARLERLGAIGWVAEGRRRRAAISDLGRVLLLGLEATKPSEGA